MCIRDRRRVHGDKRPHTQQHKSEFEAMVARLRQTRKKRGHITMGYGRVGKHRKHPAGRGNAGGFHHHRILLAKFHPGTYGKCGMRKFRLQRNRDYAPTINLDRIWTLVSEQTRTKYETAKTKDKAPVIDVTKAGYFKVLGRGRLPAVPVVVRARYFSKIAERRIRAIGGACVLTAQAPEKLKKEKQSSSFMTNRICGVACLFILSEVFSYIICLLYTSPSPRDGLLSRMPSSA
eukprot:TRINITY_DN774_c0_g1_i2.p2 TRINITY_DN774_c0_g1~~TRINITY_DN774_c0_g1_i2.p2  ORF type:complete len:234 (-),score=57.83 TRINITY_DN774_c0_g1_i2:38-739(-)